MTLKYTYGIDEQGNDREYNLEDKDFLLITAIDKLSNEIQKLRMQNGL